MARIEHGSRTRCAPTIGMTVRIHRRGIAMKRSRQAALVLMGASPLLLSACGEDAPQEAAFTSVEHCVSGGGTQESCVAAFDAAQAQHAKSAPHYSTHEACVAEFGADQCTQRTDSSGGSFWMPLMTGFFISN